MSKWTTLTLSILLTAGCSSLPTSSSPELSRQIEELQARVLALQRQTTIDKLEIDRLSARIDEVETRVERGRPPAQSSPTLREAARGIGEEALDATERPGSIEVSDLEEPRPGDVPRLGGVDSTREPRVIAEISAAAQATYDRGYTLYHQGRYFDAEESFARFLESNAGSDLADNAQYWIGESRVARGDLQPALAAFRETVRRYPDGNKAAEALFKVGRVLESLGDLRGARRSYLELRSRYPDSIVDRQAADRLAAL